MTAGQMATPYRRIRAPLLVAALAVTFGLGTLAGLAVPRSVGQAAEAASTGGAVAATTSSGGRATVATDPYWKLELQTAPNAAAAPATTGSGASSGVPNRLLPR